MIKWHTFHNPYALWIHHDVFTAICLCFTVLTGIKKMTVLLWNSLLREKQTFCLLQHGNQPHPKKSSGRKRHKVISAQFGYTTEAVKHLVLNTTLITIIFISNHNLLEFFRKQVKQLANQQLIIRDNVSGMV